MSPDQRPSGAGQGRFATTQWSVVLSAGKDSTPKSRAALSALCATYWPPLYAYLRRTGCSREVAEDTVQGFFALLLEREDLRTVSPERGRFRSFLLASLKHFLANERDRERALKRGGGRTVVSINAEDAEQRLANEPADRRTPETAFDREWALTLLERIHEQLRDEHAAAGKQERYDRLRPLLTGDGSSSLREAAAALGLSEGATKVAVHRLRQRFGELLRAEILQTVATPDEVDEEVRALFEALR